VLIEQVPRGRIVEGLEAQCLSGRLQDGRGMSAPDGGHDQNRRLGPPAGR